MDKLALLFEEFILKAVTMTENILTADFHAEETNFDTFTTNRERLFQVIEKIAQQVDWEKVPDEKRNEFNRQIEYIKKLDDELIVKLQDYKNDIKREIEVTSRNHENVKGYNLNNVK